jgi:hypothetical protein
MLQLLGTVLKSKLTKILIAGELILTTSFFLSSLNLETYLLWLSIKALFSDLRSLFYNSKSIILACNTGTIE